MKKILINKLWVIVITLLFSTNTMAKCYLDLWVIVDSKGIPQKVVNKGSKPPLPSFKKQKKEKHRGEGSRGKQICWRAYKVDQKDNSRYIRAKKVSIAIIWSPFDKNFNINFKKIVKEDIPKNVPYDISFKYSVATRASKPNNDRPSKNADGDRINPTYLDPVIVIRNIK
ncbi:MAG: hypothetical protein COB35_07240 [Gammaproteobacteria bacterium]|nr:MAG: hypothetical protein COB35_07240 [Gammaproteobacteria bacterium]